MDGMVFATNEQIVFDMKKVFLLLFVLLSASLLKDASAQQRRYYYYPASNLYFDPVGKNYIYNNNGSWTTVNSLPAGYVVSGRKKYVVYSNTPQVWRQNSKHVTKYKVTNTPKGKAVGYKGTNPNKAQGQTKVKVTPAPRVKVKAGGAAKGKG